MIWFYFLHFKFNLFCFFSTLILQLLWIRSGGLEKNLKINKRGRDVYSAPEGNSRDSDKLYSRFEEKTFSVKYTILNQANDFFYFPRNYNYWYLVRFWNHCYVLGDLNKLKEQTVVVKEGVEYRLRIVFKVSLQKVEFVLTWFLPRRNWSIDFLISFEIIWSQLITQ